MGLDLMLYATKVQYTDSDSLYAETDKDEDSSDCIEVGYGRKTWSIYYALKDFASYRLGNDDFEIDREGYTKFIEKIVDAFKYAETDADDLAETLNTYDKYSVVDLDERYDAEEITKFRRAERKMEWFYDRFSDISPTLGIDWDISYILKWYRRRDEVFEYLDKGYHLYVVASY